MAAATSGPPLPVAGHTGVGMFSAIRQLFGIVACLLLSMAAHAQYYDDPDLGQRPVYAHPQDYKPLGIRAGAFMLHPGVQLTGEYTDNALFSSEKSEVDTVESDIIYHLRPYLSAQSNWSRHSLNLSAAADIARYDDLGVRDYEDYLFGATGRIDVRTRSFLTYGLDYMMLHEDLNARNSEQGIEPTEYTLTGGEVGYDHTFNRLSLSGEASLRRLNYDNARRDDGSVIDNQDRDRDLVELSLRAGYQFQTGRQLFARWSGSSVSYDRKLDRNGFERDGEGQQIDAGLDFEISGKLTGDVFVSYAERQFDDPGLASVNGWGGGAGLHWMATQLTSVNLSAGTGVEDTTSATSAGYLRTFYSLRVDQELRRNLQLNGFASYGHNDYEVLPDAPPGARSSDDVWRFGIGFNWFLNRFVFFNLSYAYEKLDSNVPTDDYDVNRVWFGLTLER